MFIHIIVKHKCRGNVDKVHDRHKNKRHREDDDVSFYVKDAVEYPVIGVEKPDHRKYIDHHFKSGFHKHRTDPAAGDHPAVSQ